MTNPKQMRVFFGFPVEEHDAERIVKLLTEKYPNIEDSVRLTRPGNFHATMRFIGNVASDKIPTIVDAVDQNIKNFHVLDLKLESIDHFPAAHKSRLIAVHVHLSHQLAKLYAALEKAITDLDYPAEDRLPKPHITIARRKHDARFHISPIVLEDYVIKAEQLVLYESVPKDKGTVYLPVHRFALKG